MRLLVLVLAATFALTPAADARTDRNTEYGRYRAEVDRETAKTYKRDIDAIDPNRLRGKAGGHDLDHKTPVKCGFMWQIPAKEIARAENLQVVPSTQNRSDGSKGCR